MVQCGTYDGFGASGVRYNEIDITKDQAPFSIYLIYLISPHVRKLQMRALQGFCVMHTTQMKKAPICSNCLPGRGFEKAFGVCLGLNSALLAVNFDVNL